MKLAKEQKVQDDFYSFPYHYCVEFKSQFSMFYLFDWGLNYASAVEFLLEKINKNKKKDSIIDIGCGEGRLTKEIFLKFPLSKVEGVDYSNKPIQLAKALNCDFNIKFHTANIIENKLENTFDVAVLMEVYEHIEPKRAESFLKSIYELLNTNGILHLTVPHKNVPIAPHHFRHFSIQTLKEELENYFEIIEVIPFEKISVKRKWLLRLLVNRFFVLNNKKWTTRIYNYYKKNLFFVSNEAECQRIYVQCKKRKL